MRRFFVGAPLFIYSTPPFKIHPIAMQSHSRQFIGFIFFFLTNQEMAAILVCLHTKTLLFFMNNHTMTVLWEEKLLASPL